MEYAQQFERDLLRRTLQIVRSYQGSYDATNLINCLLGLLVVPKEKSLDRIPNDPVSDLSRWGISPGSIKSFGKCQCGTAHPQTLRQLVKGLRNAVAHFRIDPVHKNGVCAGFKFRGRSGFHAELPLTEMNAIVERLSEHLEKQAGV